MLDKAKRLFDRDRLHVSSKRGLELVFGRLLRLSSKKIRIRGSGGWKNLVSTLPLLSELYLNIDIYVCCSED